MSKAGMSAEAELALPSRDELMAVYNVKYWRMGEPGWSPRMRLRFEYFTPDDYYEAMVSRLVTRGCDWADIGCGRDVFPQHPDLAKELSQRAGYFFGIEPDDNIKDNPFVTERFQGLVEDCTTSHRFDLITMRMVAEHVVDPERVIAKISELLKPGGHYVVYTPHKWAPMSLIATALPFALHQPLKRLIWDAEARDTFPTAYKMNTRAALQGYCARNSLAEVFYRRLDDCRVLSRFRRLNALELHTRRVLGKLGLGYPESCILAVFRKVG